MDERKKVPVAVPLQVKREAQRRTESNMNDEIVGVLARRWRVPFVPSGRRGPASVNLVDGGKLMLRMPSELKRRIAQEALAEESNLRDVIVGALCAEYGMAFEPGEGRRSVPFGGGRRAVAAGA